MNNSTLKIAIIDCIGLNYDGTTLSKKGIGGSESSIISVARELVKIGLDVTIFNDCDTQDTQPGIYDGVQYYPVNKLGERNFNFDIVISQRTVIPFTPEHLYDQVRQAPPRDYDPSIFKQLQRPHQLKILWQQDTFIWGDHLLEDLITHKHIDEVFCLSDWHISYTTNSTHGPRRNFEVLKNHIFHTRNAINRWIDWVDVKAKDPNLFVYNASVTKGMVPLIERIWPKIKAQLPNARLKVIGGYYNFRDQTVNEANEKVIALQNLTANDPSVEFTGIIPQPKIAEIMANATYNLYPGAFPETSGIATIESINYNTPILGTRFGAMEESGTDFASYFIDYPIEPNGLFPWINTDAQVDQYVDMVLKVVRDTYLHQQKQYACNQAKDVSTWDTVALQWKQHFYRKFQIELTEQEQQQVEWINYRVHKVFGRRIINSDEIIVPEYYNNAVADNTQPKVKLAYIDIVGMTYDGSTLERKGLGGSESAVILSAREMAKIGFDVTVFNACDEDDSKPGVYDGVTYKPLSHIKNDTTVYDVVITSRVVTPFVTEPFYNYPQTTNRKIDYDDFKHIRQTAKLKVFWMHDTFCWGDEILEGLVSTNAIDEIWTLSDFHAMYVMNCSHPQMRNYEVLRRKMFTTRNGIVKYFDTVDLKAKDPNMFIFNANMSKGLQPLLDTIWPRVSQQLPDARLTVIGGHYKLGAAFAHNDEESEFNKIAGPHFNNPTITFTGIVPQHKVAELSAKASFFIYPAALPETYSISALESLYAGTLLLTCRFGALEETATAYSYFIDYPIVPNGLFPTIDPAAQADKFVDMVVAAYNDKMSLFIRQMAIESVKDIAGWDTTALEWKQHIFNLLGLYMTRSEHRRVNYTKAEYHRVFGRRYSTAEEWLAPKQREEQRIVVISPAYNAQEYIDKCIRSVAAQDYDNYQHWIIDDASTDNTASVAETAISNLPEDIQNKFFIIKSDANRGAVYNHMAIIRQLDDTDIVMLLDGDDSLVNHPDVFDYYNKIHQDNDFTYGSCWSMVDSIPLVSQPYPPMVRATKKYKDYKFNWNMPYTHLRTLKAKLLKYDPDTAFQDAEGNWFKAGGDNATFYTALGNCDPAKIYVVGDIVYNYNDASPLNDYKVNKGEQDRAINSIVGQLSVPAPRPTEVKTKLKKILIAIPTNKNIEAQTFKAIYDLKVPAGYEVTFQYFWGYQVDQVRNLIADWTMRNGFDYLFSVDSDIAFAPDTLEKLLSHDKDIVSGVYIQRIPGRHTIEIMRKNEFGGVAHVDYADIKGQGLVPIDGCGFGCVLIKTHVLRTIPYPHFLYHSAIDHANTVSEDVHFCNKARDCGFQLWCDTSILCDHIGSWVYCVDNAIQAKPQQVVLPAHTDTTAEASLRALSQQNLMPRQHVDYLLRMRDAMGVKPKVAYDIGACVLHWYNNAKPIWPDAEYVLFDAMEDSEILFKETGCKYNIGLLSNQDGKELAFYENTEHPGGNSYYRENEEFSPAAAVLFDEAHKVIKHAVTLDTVVREKNLPLPDLIKMDVQGAEMDVLKGAQETLKSVQHLILELQHVRYNVGAPFAEEVIAYLDTIGFRLVTAKFATAIGVDGDYHFTRYKYV